jgi:hypothetical protein
VDEEAWTKLEDGCWIPKGGLEIRVDVQNVSAGLQESVCVPICFVMLHLRITTKH